jgi:hypothetical protein
MMWHSAPYRSLNGLLRMLAIRPGGIRLWRPVFLAITFPALTQAPINQLQGMAVAECERNYFEKIARSPVESSTTTTPATPRS